MVWKHDFQGRFADRAHAISVFEQHNAEVQRTVPPERLLVYDVADGWEPLCRFLGVPVPDQPFPFLNKRGDFAQLVQRIWDDDQPR